MSDAGWGAGEGGRANGGVTGIRVVDLSDRLSGAFAARLFGDHGADVVLVEPPEGHALRHEPPFLDDAAGVERSVLHAYANWNKTSVVDGPELVTLLETADVVITTGRHAEVPGRPDLVH